MFSARLRTTDAFQVHQEDLLKINLHFPILKIKTSPGFYLVPQPFQVADQNEQIEFHNGHPADI